MISGTLDFTLATGNGVTTAFPFANKIFQASDLTITLIDPSGNLYAFTFVSGVVFSNAVLGLTATISGVDVDSGCTVTFSGPPTTGWSVDIRSNIPETQPTSIKNQGSFLPELHEEAFDRITRELQDLRRLTYTFGIHGPDTEGVPWTALGAANTRPNSALTFDSNGLPFTTPLSAIAGVVVAGTAVVDAFTASASQTIFTLSGDPGSLNNLVITLDGAVLIPGDDYTWSPPTGLVLLIGVVAGQRLSAHYTGSIGIASVPAGSVSDAALVAGSYVQIASKAAYPEVSLASAATTDIGNQSSSDVLVTGTTTITSFGSPSTVSGLIYNVLFSGSLLLTQNATSLILPGGQDITTLAGDSLTAKYEGSGNWRVLQYNRATNIPTNSTGDTIRRGIAVCKYKPALTAKVTTTVLANDPDLVYAIPAAGTYAIEVFVPLSGGIGGVAFNLNFSAAITASLALIELIANGASVADKSIAITGTVTTALQNAATVTALDCIRMSATLVAGAAGTLGVAWAQNASNAAATNFGQGAFMNVTLLS